MYILLLAASSDYRIYLSKRIGLPVAYLKANIILEVGQQTTVQQFKLNFI